MPITQEFFKQCGALNFANVITPYGSLTHGDIVPMTPANVIALKNTAIDDERRIYQNMMEARLAGVRATGLFDLFFGGNRRTELQLDTKSIGQTSIRLPYYLLRQKHIINQGAWRIVSGAATEGAGSGGVPTNAWTVKVRVSSSRWQSKFQSLERYFLPGCALHVFHQSSGNITQTVQFKVLSATNDDQSSGGTTIPQAAIVLQPTGVSTTGWAALTDDEKAYYQPTSGVAMNGANNVSDWEAYRQQYPADQNQTIKAFWTQRSRYTQYWTDVQKQLLSSLMADSTEMNTYVQKFQELDISEVNRIQRARYEQELQATFLFGERLPWQDENTFYQSTDGRVYDATWGEFVGEYNTRTDGVKTLLGNCGRVQDMAGAALNINDIAEQAYLLKRNRQTASTRNMQITTVPVVVNEDTSQSVMRSMIAWYKFLGLDPVTQIRANEQYAFGQRYNWTSNTYMLPGGKNLLLEVHAAPELSDHASLFTDVSNTSGNLMLFLDTTDLKISRGNANTRTSKSPDIATDSSYATIMKANVKTTEMFSEQYAVQMTDPDCHLWIENFDAASCPVITDKKCTVTEES